jgi:hypothetical protein
MALFRIIIATDTTADMLHAKNISAVDVGAFSSVMTFTSSVATGSFIF